MSQKCGIYNSKVYRLVLTGGPCGGKTTGQSRLCTFFENLGWKVYRVPETASILLGGGVKWQEMNSDEVYQFQNNLLKTMMQIENTFFDLASSCRQNCLVICDRGIMDASAYLDPEQWEKLKKANNWNEVELRDSRYNLVIHMVSAARGAEDFYHLDNNITRHEGLEVARRLDELTSQAWVGHPYYDVIDNSTDFERKVVRMIAAVCNRLGVEAGDRLSLDSKKRKFLVKKLLDDSDMTNVKMVDAFGLIDESGITVVNSYPQFQDFIVVHDYLVTPNHHMQARIRKRGQNVRWDEEKHCWELETDDNNNRYQVCCVSKDKGKTSPIFIYGTDADFSNWTYTHTIRRPEINKESPELRMQISAREYELLLVQRDGNHYTIYKKRRCFLWNNQYFQMDIYEEPCHPRCHGLIILETYTTLLGKDLELPGFLEITKEITNDGKYSMYNLSRKDKVECFDKMSATGEGNSVVDGVVDGVV